MSSHRHKERSDHPKADDPYPEKYLSHVVQPFHRNNNDPPRSRRMSRRHRRRIGRDTSRRSN